MKMYQEKKVVVISVIVLLVALWLVYALFFGTKWKDLFDNDKPKIAEVWSNTWDTQKEIVNDKVLSQSWVGLIDDILENTWETQNLTWKDNILTWEQKMNTGNNTQTNTGTKKDVAAWSTQKQDDIVWDLLAETEKKAEEAKKTQPVQQTNTGSPTDIKILHWTEVYTWRLDIVNELGLSYKYILKDSNNVYFIYLWNAVSDLRSKATKIWWNTVEITDKKVIMENSLFWEKVVFVNIPKYQKQYVFIVIKPNMQNEYWLMQVNFKEYYMLKKYLQTLFTF